MWTCFSTKLNITKHVVLFILFCRCYSHIEQALHWPRPRRGAGCLSRFPFWSCRCLSVLSRRRGAPEPNFFSTAKLTQQCSSKIAVVIILPHQIQLLTWHCWLINHIQLSFKLEKVDYIFVMVYFVSCFFFWMCLFIGTTFDINHPPPLTPIYLYIHKCHFVSFRIKSPRLSRHIASIGSFNNCNNKDETFYAIFSIGLHLCWVCINQPSPTQYVLKLYSNFNSGTSSSNGFFEWVIIIKPYRS